MSKKAGPGILIGGNRIGQGRENARVYLKGTPGDLNRDRDQSQTDLWIDQRSRTIKQRFKGSVQGIRMLRLRQAMMKIGLWPDMPGFT